MNVAEFGRVHLPALEGDEVRFNVQIAALSAAIKDPPRGFEFWALGEPGHCAMRSPGRSILLCNLTRSECERLAQDTIDGDYPGVLGAGDTAHWFAERAKSLGARFDPPIPNRIHRLAAQPRYPDAPGSARAATAADAPLLFAWLTAFHQEAVPHDPPIERNQVDTLVESGRYLFWIVDGQPVSMAAISRRLRHTGGVAPVYTPPPHRGRGYAGSVTAAVVDRIFAEGKTAACLYTDLRNPMSNRCYAKIGFQPYCDAWHYVRSPSQELPQ